MESRKPTRLAIVLKLVRIHVANLNLCLYDKVVSHDDFVLYGVRDDDCIGDDAVILHIDDAFINNKQSWVALMIKTKPYLISREECLALPRMDDTIHVDIRRIINIPDEEPKTIAKEPLLQQRQSLSSSSSNVHAMSSSSSFYERYNEIAMRKLRRNHSIYVDTKYQLFSVARHIKEGGIHETLFQTEDETNQYLKIVIDYALISTNFANPEHRLILENKLLTHYNKSILPGSDAFIDFMLNLIVCETEVVPLGTPYFDGTNLRYQFDTQIQCKMMKECVAWEVFKLRRSRDRFSLDQYQKLIDEFLLFIDKTIPQSDLLIPRPSWIYYCMNKESPNLFWACEENDLIRIRFEWLPDLAQSSLIAERLRDGTVWLTSNEFHDDFLPGLYERLLTDSFRFIWMCRLTHKEDRFVQSLALVEQENFRAMIWPLLPNADNRNTRVLLDYSNNTLSHIKSPITTTLANRERMIPRKGGNTVTIDKPNAAHTATLIASEIDIEEINLYMPPCLKPKIKKNMKLCNMDRVTAIFYLIDMGYSQEETVRLLNGTSKRDIIQAYTWQKTKKSPDRLSSLCCDALIVVDGLKDQTIRCPYEEKATGAKRRKKTDHTYDDKISYRTQCSATLGPNVERIASPIDYIKHKINDTKI